MSGERIRMMTDGLYIPDAMVVEQKKPITAHEKTNLKLRVENNELVKQLSKVTEENAKKLQTAVFILELWLSVDETGIVPTDTTKAFLSSLTENKTEEEEG